MAGQRSPAGLQSAMIKQPFHELVGRLDPLPVADNLRCRLDPWAGHQLAAAILS